MSPHPADLSLVDVGRALRQGTLTSVALLRAHLDRISERDTAIGAFVHVARDEALAAAAHADAALASGQNRGPLHGIPFAVKDLIDVASWPVRYGSRRFGARVAEHTATAVQRLRDAGAIPLGLVATYELATVGPDPGSLYPQPKNPWNRAHVTGGSSSGAAAAVAAGLVRFALGTDTGGSIRSPAAFCGVAGFKPARGAVDMTGVQPLAPSLDMVGPLAASVAELAVVEAALAGRDPGQPARDLRDLRIGYARAWAEDAAAHPALIGLLDAAASALSLAGAQIELVDLPDYKTIEDMAATILQAEQSQVHADLIAENGRDLGAKAYQSLLWGHPLDPDRIAHARQAAREITDEIEARLARFDAVILPTVMAPAASFLAQAGEKAVWTPMRTIPFNLTGHAALSVPMGFADGLPMGLQVTAAFGRAATILRIGAAYEAATDHTAVPAVCA